MTAYALISVMYLTQSSNCQYPAYVSKGLEYPLHVYVCDAPTYKAWKFLPTPTWPYELRGSLEDWPL